MNVKYALVQRYAPLLAGSMVLAIILIFVIVATLPVSASAYTIEKHNDQLTGDLVISPTKVELEMKPGDTATRDVMVANRTGETVTVEFSLEDFEGSQDPAEATVFMGDKDSSYGARHWLEPEITSINLQQGELLTFRVKITVPKSAEPGGHYAVLFASTKNQYPSEEEGSVLNVTQRVGSLFLIRVAGNIEEQGTLNSPEVPTFSEYGPINIGLVFNNQGNVHLKPHGKLYISNMLGQTVAEIDVKEWVVLPQASRRLNVPWDSHWLFGRYSVRAEIEYGTDGNKLVASASFWALPWKIILATISSLVIFVILLSWLTRGRRQSKAAMKREIERLRAVAATKEDEASSATPAAPRPSKPLSQTAAAAPPIKPTEAPENLRTIEEEPEVMEEPSKHVPLNELFPSMKDSRLVDITDNETRKLLRTMIAHELDLARAYIAEGRTEDARRELMEARVAAQKLGLLSEVGLIDDMLHWA